MPRFLTREAARLIEGSIEALRLAITGIGAARTDEHLQHPHCFAPEVGLVGSSADLALKACVCQVAGRQMLFNADGTYRKASETLKDFRKLLNSGHPRLVGLIKGVADPPLHLQTLGDATGSLRVLFTARAAGLHMAAGVSRQVVVYAANQVRGFIELIGRSDRFSHYIRDLPSRLEVSKERFAVAQDLARVVQEATDVGQVGSALLGIYLILPDVVEEQPDWLAALDRVAVAPTRRDIGCLVTTLRSAQPTQLFRVSGSGDGIPARIDPDDPHALAIAPQNLKWSLSDVPDQWRTDIGLANGRIRKGVLHLPPMDFVYQLFVLGLGTAGIGEQYLQQGLTAHQSWPFIACSLNVSSRQTSGPLWFVVSAIRDGELGQLLALLKAAASVGGMKLSRNVAELEPVLEALQRRSPLPSTADWAMRISDDRERVHGLWVRLEETLDDLAKQRAGEPVAEIARRVDDEGGVGTALVDVAGDSIAGLGLPDRRKWARLLSEVADTYEEAPGVLAVLGADELAVAHTAARKAIRLIDFNAYGPDIAENPA